MAKVVNLNKFRKKKAAEAAEKLAEENRLKHGRSKEQRASQEAARELLERRLQGSKLDAEAAGAADEDEPTPDA